MVSTTNSERTPLLGSTDAGTQHIGDTLSRVTRPISPAKRVLILGLTFSLLIALAIGGTLFDTPITEIQEDIICHRIHGPNLEPGVCKEKEVQSELSFIRGWDTTFTMLPSLIVSVPYGAIADRYGRTLVLGLSLLGITLNAAFGTLVAISFFYIGASLMGGALMANPIVYLAMKRGPWFSIEAGLICLSIATVIAFLIPETLDRTPASKASLHSHQTNSPPQSTDTGLNTGCIPTAGPNNIPTSINNSTSPQREPTDNPQGPVATGLSSITVTLLHTLSSIRFLFWDHKLVGLLLISLALEILGRSAILLLLQYAAKRYGMSYSEAGLLDSVTALTSLDYASLRARETFGSPRRAL
ncbi:hypothetical protein MMYC01_201549 [Madurella mycetomatis]|uniref:Uncharacterized protein n=1 Tax=Madurella mycetomatis TaxID=100816 RepID=A0A175WEJ5_9PEZI|nr:hypothetical protein MMYC01_201549 [Madurella mycetomatis]